jgi:hypothetical protein
MTITATETHKRTRMQRDVTYQDLQKWFHEPMHIASIQLSLSTRELRAWCAKYNIKRWPYKKQLHSSAPKHALFRSFDYKVNKRKHEFISEHCSGDYYMDHVPNTLSLLPGIHAREENSKRNKNTSTNMSTNMYNHTNTHGKKSASTNTHTNEHDNMHCIDDTSKTTQYKNIDKNTSNVLYFDVPNNTVHDLVVNHNESHKNDLYNVHANNSNEHKNDNINKLSFENAPTIQHIPSITLLENQDSTLLKKHIDSLFPCVTRVVSKKTTSIELGKSLDCLSIDTVSSLMQFPSVIRVDLKKGTNGDYVLFIISAV